MPSPTEAFVATQLQARRQRLQTARAELGETAEFQQLLREVDGALDRLPRGPEEFSGRGEQDRRSHAYGDPAHLLEDTVRLPEGEG